LVDVITAHLVESTGTSFRFDYLNNRPGGSPPVNAVTVQVAGGAISIQSATFAGVIGKPTNYQNAFIWYPLGLPSGSKSTGLVTTDSPVMPGTPAKFFFSTDGFGSNANTTSVDATIGSPIVASQATIGSVAFSFAGQWGGFRTKGATASLWRLRPATIYYDQALWDSYAKKKEPLGVNTFLLGGSFGGPGPVDIAIVRMPAPNQCLWLNNNKGDFLSQPCPSPIWLPAKETGKGWTYALKRLPPPGKYIFESRGSSSEQDFSRALHNQLSLVIALHHK
jgi:hypothetical protein